MSPDRHVLFANRFFRQRFGEIQGRHCYESMPQANERYCPRCTTFDVLKTNSMQRWEWSATDGRDYEVYDFPFTDTDGSRLVMKVGMDVTERRRAEAAIRWASGYNRRLIDACPDPLAIIGPDGKVTDINPATEHATGLGRDELIGTDFTDYFTSPDEARLGYLQAFKEGAVRDYPLEIRHRDGHITPVLYNAAVYRDERGDISGVFAVARDMTELRQAEQTLRRAAEEHATMLATTPDGFWVLDQEGRIIDVNDGYCQLSGYSREELLAMKVWDLEAVESPQQVLEHIEKIVRDGFDRYETRHRRKDGGVVDVEISVTYWREACRLLLFARNITDRIMAQTDMHRLVDDLQDEVQVRIMAQEQLASSNLELHQRAEQLARLASELTLAEQRERYRLAQVLHDHLQQLLVGATFGLEVLWRRLQDETQRSSLQQIKELLTESIATSRSLTVELCPPILHQSGLGPALEWLARSMQEKHALRVELALEDEATVHRDDVKVLLFQAVRELLLNVVKHAKVNRAAVGLRLSGENHVEVQVADEGPGFDSSRASGGTGGGFGLFSIRERLGLLGGRLEIDSAPQRGSRIRMMAPRYEIIPADRPFGDIIPAAAPQTYEERGGDSAQPQHHIRLLLVDDHVVMRHGLSTLLAEEADIKIVGEASDGYQAIQMTSQLHPDVILMDYGMPRMNGLDATRIIHADYPQIRIIGLSMYSEADQAAAMLEAGASAYATKSGQSDALLAAIRGQEPKPSQLADTQDGAGDLSDI